MGRTSIVIGCSSVIGMAAGTVGETAGGAAAPAPAALRGNTQERKSAKRTAAAAEPAVTSTATSSPRPARRGDSACSATRAPAGEGQAHAEHDDALQLVAGSRWRSGPPKVTRRLTAVLATAVTSSASALAAERRAGAAQRQVEHE